MEETLNLGLRVPFRDPLSLTLEAQLSKFLIGGSKAPMPNLVVIDGLDECASQDGICKLIELIELICKNSPFRFLLTSRPEPWIEASFSSGLYRGHSNALILALTESKADIRRCFVVHLGNLWRKQRRLNRGHLLWPSESDPEKLVEQSEGLFIYAATAVRHIGGKGAPENRLDDVLKLHKGLDNPYIQAIEEASEWDYFSIVMGSLLYSQYPPSIYDLSTILHPLYRQLMISGIHYALGGCHSILAIAIDDDTAIEPYHASKTFLLTSHGRRPSCTPLLHLMMTHICLSFKGLR